MIRITDTQKPQDRFGSIPILTDEPMHNPSSERHLTRRPKKPSLWIWLKRAMNNLRG
jgi:hypothetical protein